MSVVVGLHLQSDHVRVAVIRDASSGGRTATADRSVGSVRIDSQYTFPAALRWPAHTAAALPDRRHADATYRHFVDHLGDPRPLSAPGGPDRLADDLAARLLVVLVAHLEATVGEHVARLLIAHPTFWTVPQVSLFHRSLVDAGLADHRALLLVPDTDAALEWVDHCDGLDRAHGVTVCDLRDDSAVVAHARRPRSGHLTTITAHRFPGLGVCHLDDRLEHRVLAKAAQAGHPVPPHPALVAQVRAHCAEVRTTLRTMSTRMEVVTPGVRGLEQHGVTLTLDDLYGLARPQAAEIVRALQRCGDTDPGPDHVVLIGTAPTFPLLADSVAARFDCPVVIPADAEFVCARGAALLAATSPVVTPMTQA
ncbi:MAG TPA: molecular chaperone [Gordonia polyisoprenivorans]|nr:molecular chaperone [Gordonia polyisoprenivorans]